MVIRFNKNKNIYAIISVLFCEKTYNIKTKRVGGQKEFSQLINLLTKQKINKNVVNIHCQHSEALQFDFNGVHKINIPD